MIIWREILLWLRLSDGLIYYCISILPFLFILTYKMYIVNVVCVAFFVVCVMCFAWLFFKYRFLNQLDRRG